MHVYVCIAEHGLISCANWLPSPCDVRARPGSFPGRIIPLVKGFHSSWIVIVPYIYVIIYIIIYIEDHRG